MIQYNSQTNTGEPVKHKVLGQILDIEDDRPKVATATFDPQPQGSIDRWSFIARRDSLALWLAHEIDSDRPAIVKFAETSDGPDCSGSILYSLTRTSFDEDDIEPMPLDHIGALAVLAGLAEVNDLDGDDERVTLAEIAYRMEMCAEHAAVVLADLEVDAALDVSLDPDTRAAVLTVGFGD